MFTTMAMSTLEPTIPIWIIDTMKAPKWQLGTYPEMIYKYYEILVALPFLAPVAMRLLKLCRSF